MNYPTVTEATRQRLVSLLEYIAQQAHATDISKLNMGHHAISAASLEHLPAVQLGDITNEDVWLTITRLHPEPPPELPTHALSQFCNISQHPFNHPQLDFIKFKSDFLVNPAFLAQIEAHQTQLNIDSDIENLSVAQYTEQLYQDAASTLQSQFDNYMTVWQAWYLAEQPRRSSIQLYDLLFAWRMSLASATGTAQELVAGMGLIGWKLPSSGHHYFYPLITQTLEITCTEAGDLQIRPRDTLPQLEFDAFLAQESIPQAGQLRQSLRAMLAEHGQVSIFDHSSYTEVLAYAVHQLSSRGELCDTAQDPTIGNDPQATHSWRFFIRTRASTVLQDDVEKLQDVIKNGADIPEQPLSLVMPPSTESKVHEPVKFRGRGGIEGTGEHIQELYFPLPYNREQITIIDQLSKNAGVVVQGPPGTGKTHTIANIISHYLALGKRVLVTAEKGHVLKTVQEKIPDAIRPLVISRVGTEQESRKQLEFSIDSILQQLTQINPNIVSENIAQAQQNIERIHSKMSAVDAYVNEIAWAHYKDIEVDGIKQWPDKIADLVIHGESHFKWFDDVITLDEKHTPPLNLEQSNQLRSARERVGQNLYHLNTQLPPINTIPTLETIHQLHQHLTIINQLDADEKSGKLWPLTQQKSDTEYLTVLRALQQHVELAILDIQKFNQKNQEYVWMNGFRDRLRQPNNNTERQLLEQILPELVDFIKIRAGLLNKPISLSNTIFNQPKAIEAISRAIETGQPFNWYNFGQTDLKSLIENIKISGLPPQGIEDWKWVGEYCDLHPKLVSFFTRWNQIANTLNLPEFHLLDKDLTQILRDLDITFKQIELTQHIMHQHGEKLINSLRENFDRHFSVETLDKIEELNTLHQQISQHAQRIDLSNATNLQQNIIDTLQAYSTDLIMQFVTLIKSLGTIHAPLSIDATYTLIFNEIKKVHQLKPDFMCINDAALRFTNAGAPLFAKRLQNIPIDSTGEDTILPLQWPDAWLWARLNHFLQSINQRQKLAELSIQRHELEHNLAKFYEQIATQQAWLSLKKSASDQVMTALNRYKTAIQKIGKGTGKNASRYRKDAQQAMLEAAEAIPCWVMTHHQVSESMPARLGMFDLIIIDEASQSTIEALPVLLRGKKLLIVGDDKQVSPSNVGLSSERIDLLRQKYLQGQPHASILTPNMSLYDMASSIYASNVMLLEHFRCHPSIIAYSNKTYYNNKIKPMRLSKSSERLDPCLISIYVPDGIRSKASANSDINKIEADAIIAEIKNIIIDNHYQGRSIGVISLLGLAQAEYIQRLAFDEIGQMELVKRDFSCGDASAFQGAERDIIFLSMVATPESCHALSRRDHEQRFNVAASRARERMYLVHSVQPEQLSAKDLRTGLLEYYSTKPAKLLENLDEKISLCESWFEKDLLEVLIGLGYHATPQMTAGNFNIDIVVEGDGDSRLAIECDADSPFHGPEKWSSDIAQQRALERAGWTFWRCFASTWKLERMTALQDLIETLDSMDIFPFSTNTSKLVQLIENRTWYPPENSYIAIDTSETAAVG